MRKVMICSGAGLSAESGISTFRDSGGLWENFAIEEVCDITTFEQNYIKVNEFYNSRRKQLSTVEPNSAHKSIAELTNRFPDRVINYTTNVDDLLERAGCDNVVHIHGNLLEVVTKYGTDESAVVNVGYGDSPFEDLSLYPVKPNVVFFGEHAPVYETLYAEVGDLSINDILVIIGSSEQVISFVYLARYVCNFHGTIHFVNKDERLTYEMAETNAVVPFAMNATEYFKCSNLLGLLAEEDDVG